MSKVKFPRVIFVIPSGDTFTALKDAKEAAALLNPEMKAKDAIRKYIPVLPKEVPVKKASAKKPAKKAPAKKPDKKSCKSAK